MAFIGFNASEVRACADKVKESYNDLMEVIKDKTKSEFVDKVSEQWYFKASYDWFNQSFKPAMEEIFNGVNATFDSVINSVDDAAYHWADLSGNTSLYTKSSLSLISATMDVSNIKDNLNGATQMDVEGVNSTLSVLSTLSSSASNALSSAVTAVNSSGFIGGEQQAKLVNSLNKIKEKIIGVYDEAKEQTKSFASEYGTAATELKTNVENAFSGQGE